MVGLAEEGDKPREMKEDTEQRPVHLYTYEGKDIYDSDFIEAFSRLGVKHGDTILVHSDISVFGKPVLEGDTLLRGLVEVLKRSVGSEGTVVLPTFTYSFTKGEPYDPKTSRSTVGSLSEFFRTQEGAVRNLHPIFSVAAWGKHAEDFMHIGKDSLGEGTVFERARELDATFVFLGTTLGASCTFLHYIEQMHKVPYRYMKEFTGTIVTEHPYEDTYTYFVRNLDGSAENDLWRAEPPLRAKGILREVSIGNGIVSAARAREVYEEVMKLLDADPYALTEKKI